MHTIGREWVGRHGDAAEDDPSACRDCHGADYRGSVLSRALGDRVLDTEFGRKELWRGFQVTRDDASCETVGSVVISDSRIVSKDD